MKIDDNKELMHQIAENESDYEYCDNTVRCDWCGDTVFSGKYYIIDGERICCNCIENCEYFL